MMNAPIFPAAVILTAAAATEKAPNSLIEVASQYGPLGLITLALGIYTVWNQKQTRKREDEMNDAREVRDEKARAERKEQLDALVKVIDDQRHVNDENTAWMRGQMEKK